MNKIKNIEKLLKNQSDKHIKSIDEFINREFKDIIYLSEKIGFKYEKNYQYGTIYDFTYKINIEYLYESKRNNFRITIDSYDSYKTKDIDCFIMFDINMKNINEKKKEILKTISKEYSIFLRTEKLERILKK